MKLFFVLVQVAIVAKYATDALPFSIPNNLIPDISKKVLPALRTAWDTFKTDFNKEYADEIEALKREAIFLVNVAKISQLNKGNVDFKLAIQKFADFTEEELKKLMTGFVMNLFPEIQPGYNSTNGSIPSSLDWSKTGWTTSVKDQGYCGSCWAFTTVGVLEGQMMNNTGSIQSLSAQQLVDCSPYDYGCMGGDYSTAFKYILQNKGVETESSYPYTSYDDNYDILTCNVTNSTGYAVGPNSKIVSIGDNDDTIMKALVTHGPLAVAFCTEYKFFYYSTGVYSSDTPCSAAEADHTMVLVGYNSTATTDYWIVKNSWGTAWGEKGYVRIRRNKMLIVDAAYIVVQ